MFRKSPVTLMLLLLAWLAPPGLARAEALPSRALYDQTLRGTALVCFKHQNRVAPAGTAFRRPLAAAGSIRRH